MMANFPWIEFLLLSGAGVFGAVAIMPYAGGLSKVPDTVKLSKGTLYLLSIIQNVVLVCIATGLGLLASRALGLSVAVEASALPIALLLGLAAVGVLILVEELIFKPRISPEIWKNAKTAALWKRALASFYGGITEEVFMRLFLLSGIFWLLNLFWKGPEGGRLAAGAFWTANILAAVLFGIGHLPATKAVTKLTPLLVVRAIILNGIVGIACGWLFYRYGLIAAMLAHFLGDIVLHVVYPEITKKLNASPNEQLAGGQSAVPDLQQGPKSESGLREEQGSETSG